MSSGVKVLRGIVGMLGLTAAAAIAAAPMGMSPEGQKAAAPDLAVNARGEMALLWVDRSPQSRPVRFMIATSR